MGARFTSSNTAATLVDGVTARDIVAAPGDSAERVYIESITVTNATSGENPIVTIYTATGGLVDTFAMGDIGDAQVGTNASVTRVYPSPRQGYVGEKISATASSATGDCYVTISGYYAR